MIVPRQARARAQGALDQIRAGTPAKAVDVMAQTTNLGKRRAAMAGMILAANITPAEQESLRDWLDTLKPED